jgi:hypothetical protein
MAAIVGRVLMLGSADEIEQFLKRAFANQTDEARSTP